MEKRGLQVTAVAPAADGGDRTVRPMRRRGPAVAIGLVVALAAAAADSGEAQDRSLRDGVYSAEQARRGQARYASACAACHLADLTGTLAGDTGAPPLRGEAFIAFIEGWNARRLFDYIKATMPADDPASLPEIGVSGRSGVSVSSQRLPRRLGRARHRTVVGDPPDRK